MVDYTSAMYPDNRTGAGVTYSVGWTTDGENINVEIPTYTHSEATSGYATIAPPIEQCSLNAQVDYWSKAIHEAAQRLREISVKMQEAA